MVILLQLAILFAWHYVADFTHLSTKWMLSAKARGWPFHPIVIHAGVVSLPMFGVFTWASHSAQIGGAATLVQWATHILLDVWKGWLAAHVPVTANMDRRPYWYLLGFDQLMHQLILLALVAGCHWTRL